MKSYLPVTWRPVGGINADRAPVALESEEVSESTNWLFERGVARVRPHLLLDQVWAFNGMVFARSFLIDRGGTFFQEPYVVFERSAGVFKWNPYDGTPLAELTGSGFSIGSGEHANISSVNDSIMLGNNAAGMVYWTIGASAYSIQTDAKYRYFTGLNSRAVGAFRIEGGNQDPREIGWSVAGDITDWTSAGAGSTSLSDLQDSVSGLRTVGNTVVILRNDGYSYGRQTGNSTPAFRFETPVRKGIGFPYPTTIEEYNNSIYGVGREDVFEFTLEKGMRPIGTKIRSMLMRHLAAGISYRGVIVRGDRGAFPGTTQSTEDSQFVPRLRYHLVPVGSPHDFGGIEGLGFAATRNRAPHFSYDVEAGTWAVHTYNFLDQSQGTLSPMKVAYEGVSGPAPSAHQSTKLSFLMSDVGDQYDWTENHNSVDEEPARLRSKVIKIGDGQSEYRTHNMLVTWALEGDYTAFDIKQLPKVEVTVRAKSRYAPREETRQIDLALLASGDPEEWYNSWFTMQITGNLFELFVEVPAPVRIAIESITLYVSEGGTTRAGVTRATD